MLEDIITLIIALLPALAAWAVPKLRKSNGKWLISLKTVLQGIVALCVSDMLTTWLYRWRCECHSVNLENLHFGIPDTLKDKLYIVPVPNKNISSWSWPYEKDGKIVISMGENTFTTEDVTGILNAMVYYGCITNKFYSSTEKTESKISESRNNP